MKIYKTILYTLLLFLIISYTEIQSFASQNGKIEYNYILFDYSKLNFQKIKNDADKNFNMFLNAKNETDKRNYLDLATSKYYILTKPIGIISTRKPNSFLLVITNSIAPNFSSGLLLYQYTISAGN